MYAPCAERPGFGFGLVRLGSLRIDEKLATHNNRRFTKLKGIMSAVIDHPALQPLKAKFPETKFLVKEFRDMVTVVVPREMIVPVCTFLRDDPSLRYDMLAELNGVDYLNYPGARNRFAVNYGLTSTPNNNRLWLRVFLDPTQETSPNHDVRDEEALEKGDPGLK